MKRKAFSPPNTVLTSLLALREELLQRDDPRDNEIITKINSCLFSKYPLRWTNDCF